MIVDNDLGITLSDGTRLSAKIWRPITSNTDPVPAILEYLPYRKSDGTAERDDTMHPVFAANGYACLRVDRRGCGDSGGEFDDEYSPQELADGVEIINWIAAQPWCTGRVGMQGISWGGFNGVQIATLAPKPLRAVISIGTTVDRFTNDIHYKGGVQLSENIGWAATATSWLSMPADPELAGEDWRKAWLKRLETMPFMAERWTRESDRSAYWKQGSICEHYAAIKAPVLVMGGLHDGYRNAMAAMVENLSCPVQGITGPWSHKYPHISTIAPSMDYIGVALRWWDKWLKDAPNGAETDPEMRLYLMDSIAPDDALTERPGQWIAFGTWPPARSETLTLALSDKGLGAPDHLHQDILPDLRHGEACGEFFPYGFGPGELPGDQQIDDAHACVFDTDPLENSLCLIGAPTLQLSVQSKCKTAQIVARLSDVHPDGRATLISLGLLNLRHRNGYDQKADLESGQVYDVSLTLDQSAYHLPAGHRLRLSLASSYWPYAWPEAELGTLHLSAGSINLPLVAEGDLKRAHFDPPRPYESNRFEQKRDEQTSKTWHTDDTGRRVLKITADHGRVLDSESGLFRESHLSETWRAAPHPSAETDVTIEWQRMLGRKDWNVETSLMTTMKGTPTHFEIAQDLTARESGEVIFQRRDHAKIPR